MRALQRDNIVDLFVWVDNIIPKALPNPKGGRPPVLSHSELLTILIWDGLTEGHQALKEVYDWIKREYADCFPELPQYKNFVMQCHQHLPQALDLLVTLLVDDTPLRFVDSTMLPVCKPVRADRHKVAKNIADFGKNWQGWHYGFKLHLAIDHLNRLAAVHFTPANEHDAQMLPYLVNEHTKLVIGDSAYGASVMRRKLYRALGIIVLAPPHYKQDKQVLIWWQLKLLQLRPKIEAVFSRLKLKHKLVTSYPRSVTGYFVHYIRMLLAYQICQVS